MVRPFQVLAVMLATQAMPLVAANMTPASRQRQMQGLGEWWIE